MADAGTELRPGLLESLRRLADDELVSRIEALARREHVDTALLVAHLAELDTRDAYLRAGYSSLFTYCRDALALSEHESYNRIEVARAARRFPVVLELLACGAVNLTSVRLLAPHLTPENHAAVLESARGKKRAEVEEIVARLAPFPEVPPTIRKLPARPAYPPPLPRGPDGPGDAGGSTVADPVRAGTDARTPVGFAPAAASPSGSQGPGQPAPDAGGPAARPPWPPPPGISPATAASVHPRPGFYRPPSGDVTPLAPDRYRLQCTIDGATLEKLRLAQDMLRHAVPSGDEAAILDRAFTALLVDLARSKFAAVENPQPPRGSAPGSRYVPAEVKRAVWVRDLGRCAFVGTEGRRCQERAFVEFHHVRPYAAGGEPTLENIQLRCRRHNGYEARLFFDRGPGADGGSVAREPRAPYSDGSPEEGRPTVLVSERVRMFRSTLSNLSSAQRPARAVGQTARDAETQAPCGGQRARTSVGRVRDGSAAAAPRRAAQGAGASRGRPAARGSRPPPRRG